MPIMLGFHPSLRAYPDAAQTRKKAAPTASQTILGTFRFCTPVTVPENLPPSNGAIPGRHVKMLTNIKKAALEALDTTLLQRARPSARPDATLPAHPLSAVDTVIDVEFHIYADRREGLLLELGRIVMNSGFNLLRPRLSTIDGGVLLTLAVRGPNKHLLALQDRLSCHALVRSFESNVVEPLGRATTSGADATAKPALATSVPDARDDKPDHQRVEAVLGQLARSFPNIFDKVLAFERDLPPNVRDVSTHYAGKRLGAWVFKRDYALGARLNLAKSIKQIALPALRELVRNTELADGHLHVKDSPLCDTQRHAGASCHFLRGYLEGLLGESDHLGSLRVTELSCRNTGAEACTFAITPIG
jgi:predicted hydrocarbon binding protein